MSAKKSPATYLFGKVATSLIILFSFQHVSAQFGSRNTRPAIPDLFNSGSRSGQNVRQSCGYSPVKQITSLTPTEYETLRLYATYYSVRNGVSATLMLNNKGAEPLQANPTFYSLAGTRLQIAPITVPAASYIEVDMRQLLSNAGDQFREGSLNISYQGGPLQLGAQVRLVDQQHELIWAEQMVYTTKFLSSSLENVWWLPTENTDTRLIVSNTSSSTLTATIKVEGTSPAQTAPTQISLNPWETRVIDIMRDLVGSTGNLLTKGGISVSHTGAPGAVLARMYVAKPSAGYSASINFLDPQTAVSSKWNGNGFRLRNLDGSPLGSVLVARNTSDQTAHLRGRIPFTRPNGEMDAVLIPAVSIGARSSKSVNLSSLIGNADLPVEVSVAGIELEYDTAPGTVITSVQSVSSDGQHVFQVPMMDPQNIPSSAGGFPWKADGDFHTFVYIKNETTIARKYIAYLLFNGGGYSTGVKELRAGESAAIDFRDLRDNQVPDPSGRLIPLDLTTGQIAWSVVGSENKVLTGRSEQISLSNGIASTYACYNPCGNTYHTGWVDPVTAEAEVGSEQQFVANEVDVNAYGQIMPSFIPDGVSWDSSDWSIASVDSFGMADAVDVGSTSIQATWEGPHWWLEGTGVCDYTPIIVIIATQIDVPPTVRITPFELVGKNNTFPVSVEIIGGTSNSTITLNLTKLSGTGEAQFENNTSTLNITQSGTYNIKGVTESSIKDNYLIDARVNGSSRSSDTFSIATVKMYRTVGNQQPVEITDTRNDTIVGDRFKLSGRVLPQGIIVTNHAWTIPGETVQEFYVSDSTRTPQSGGSIPVQGLNTDNVNFIWVNGAAKQRDVVYVATLAGTQMQATANFNVQKVTTELTSVAGVTGTLLNYPQNGFTGMLLYPASGTTHGIEFTRGATSIPAPYTGHFQFVQIANHVTATQTTTTGAPVSIPSLHGLDECYPYILNETHSYDTPGIPLETSSFIVATSTFDSNFDTYLMFKPDITESDWVPLKIINWTWIGEVNFITNSSPHAWTSIQHTNPGNATGTDVTNYPTWSQVTRSVQCTG